MRTAWSSLIWKVRGGKRSSPVARCCVRFPLHCCRVMHGFLWVTNQPTDGGETLLRLTVNIDGGLH